MRFRVLGPLEVRSADGRVLALTAAGHRALLAVLVLHANLAVPVEVLVEARWAGHPPRSAGDVLRAEVSALHRLLVLNERSPTVSLSAGPGGYRLSVPPRELDLAVFRHRAEQGELARLNGDLPAAAELLTEALSLWRGRVAEDAGLDAVAPATLAELEERRLGVLETLMEVRLALGHSDVVLTELQPLVVAHPQRDRLWTLWMRALYGSD
jgi:DNA-binding SARP family transcriptional activator